MRPTQQSSINRLEQLNKYMGNDPTSNMAYLLEKLSPSVIVPEADKYYTFVYTPKTRNIRYDQHPFIQVSSVQKWGFVGLNYHWDDFRRYSWAECGTPLFEIYPDEIEIAQTLPIALFKQS